MQDKMITSGLDKDGHTLSISDLHTKFLGGDLCPSDLLSRSLTKIQEQDGRLHAFITVMESEAIAAAVESDRRYKERNPLSPIDGIPIGIKDNIDVMGSRCTAGTSVYRDRIPPESAEIVHSLTRAGGLIVGKTNLFEAAFGGTTNNPIYGCCENPLHSGYTSGGSSGGSATGVAAGFFKIGVGTDTMGSVRIPSAYCGLWGFIPTPGRSSKKGVIPLSPTLDRLGFITSSIQDLHSLQEALCGRESTSNILPDVPVLRGLRIGVLSEAHFWRSFESLSQEQQMIQSAYASLVALMRKIGVRLIELELDRQYFSFARRSALIKTENEAAHYWAPETGENFNGLSESLAKMLSYGRNISAERLVDIDRTLHRIKRDVCHMFKRVDAIFIPTVLGLPFKHSDNVPDYQADLCVLANIAQTPALGMPLQSAGDWPLSFQLLMPSNTDQKLLQVAFALHNELQSGLL